MLAFNGQSSRSSTAQAFCASGHNTACVGTAIVALGMGVIGLGLSVFAAAAVFLLKRDGEKIGHVELLTWVIAASSTIDSITNGTISVNGTTFTVGLYPGHGNMIDSVRGPFQYAALNHEFTSDSGNYMSYSLEIFSASTMRAIPLNA